MTELHFHVEAEAAPQGSKRGIVHRSTGRVVLIESSRRVKPYRDLVRAAALQARPFGDPLLDGPLHVGIHFRFQRPKSHYGTGRNGSVLTTRAPATHTQRPDLDKLVRATLDGLTGTVWYDDAQVVSLLALKSWRADPSMVAVTVSPMTGEDIAMTDGMGW